VNPLQSEKAPFPIVLTDPGNVTSLRLLIPLHKYAGIVSTSSPNVNDLIWERIL
jgi:hypothetical protein